MVVLVSSSIWPSLMSKITKQEGPVDWFYDRKDLAMLATFSGMANSLGHTIRLCKVIVQTIRGHATFGERFAMWFRGGTVRHGMPRV